MKMSYYRIKTGSRSHPIAYYRFCDAQLRVEIVYCNPSSRPAHYKVMQFTRLTNDLVEYYELQAVIRAKGDSAPHLGPSMFTGVGAGRTVYISVHDGAHL